MTTDAPGLNTCIHCGYEFTKHLRDGSVWCPSCGEIVEPDTFHKDLPGLLDGDA